MPESLASLLRMMRAHGVVRVYAKRLRPNDNSKNQIYLGGDFSALNIIPHGEVEVDDSETGGSVRDRAKAPVRFFWIDADGRHPAPEAGLILYPRYPEIRLSGLLSRCPAAPSALIRVRDQGRVLVLGVCADGAILGYAAPAGHPVAREIASGMWSSIGIFLEIPVDADEDSPREQLLRALGRISAKGWIASQRLGRGGAILPYQAMNGGGYTLEAELGISPNGFAEPDYLGWEVKQFGVSDFTSFRPLSPVTLMTPEPSGGLYRTLGVAGFLRRFGYPDRHGREDRINFGGIYDCSRARHPGTGLRMTISGYDAESGKITDMGGNLALVTDDGEVAAEWPFVALMQHWNRKHAQAVYVPAMKRGPPPEYAYAREVLLCEQTDFLLFMRRFADGTIYYDPAIKIENASGSRPIIKRRSQFRVRHSGLTSLYEQTEQVVASA